MFQVLVPILALAKESPVRLAHR